MREVFGDVTVTYVEENGFKLGEPFNAHKLKDAA